MRTGRIYIYREPSWNPVSAGERYTNDTRVWYNLRQGIEVGWSTARGRINRQQKQADYSEIKIFAWKYKMGCGPGSV